MPLKTPTRAVCSPSAAAAAGSPVATLQCRSRLPAQTSQKQRQDRRYATVRQDTDGRESPHCWPSSKHPTPYEVFNLARGDAYTKARFYELVKMYHPDRSHHAGQDGVPQAVRLERYRLVVAAHGILCDPVKRRAYDLYGAGWAQQPQDLRQMYRDADRAWRQEPGNAANNATWEDWERWHRERDGKKQEPLYMSNAGFTGIILLFVLIGSWGQSMRVGNHTANVIERYDQRHSRIGHDLRRRHAEIAPLDREARVESFLRQREGWDYGTGHMPSDAVNK